MSGSSRTAPRDASPSRVFCIHEDRPNCLTGAKLAVLGLAAHAPAVTVVVSCPGAPADFRRWVNDQPNATLVTTGVLRATGWNVKPTLLLRLLESHDEVIWLDSDIVVTAALDALVLDEPDDVLVATEETFWGQQQGGTFRTIGWGLKPGRALASTVNTGLLRATRRHIPLLQAWQTMLLHPAYLKAQAEPWQRRPLHMIGDQEVLTGLLGAVDFADVPLKLLRRGTDIAQCFGPSGFTPRERLRSLVMGRPALVHAMGPKPWQRGGLAPALLGGTGPWLKRLRAYYQYLALDLSPYSIAARAHASELHEPHAWLAPRSRLGRTLHAAGGGHLCLTGFGLSLVDYAARFARKHLAIGRYSVSPVTALKARPY